MSYVTRFAPVEDKLMKKSEKPAVKELFRDVINMFKVEKRLLKVIRKSGYDNDVSLRMLEWIKTREPASLKLFIISQSFKKFKFKSTTGVFDAFNKIDCSEHSFSNFIKLSSHNQEFIVSKIALSLTEYNTVDNYIDVALAIKEVKLVYVNSATNKNFKKFYRINKRSLNLNSYKESLKRNEELSSGIRLILLNAKSYEGRRHVSNIVSYEYPIYLALYFVYGRSILELLKSQSNYNSLIGTKEFIKLLESWESVKELPLEWALNLVDSQ